MKRIFLTVICILFSVAGCNQAENNIPQDKVYFFYSNGCPHCHDALAYIDQKYPSAKVAMVNVSTPGGYEMLLKFSRAYKLSGNIGTPLITFGNNYLMGWGTDSGKKFDEYVQPFLQ